MPHLPTGTRLRLAIQMQLHARIGQRRRPVRLAVAPHVAEQIRHRRRRAQFRGPERQPANGAQLLLELTRHTRVDREMPRVVRARREFVHEQFSRAREKHFHREQPHDLELFENSRREFARLPREFRRDGRGRECHVEDVIRVRVFENGERRKFSARRPRGHDRQFLGKIHERLVNPLCAVQRRPRRGQLRCVVQLHLPLPVVTETRRLQNRGQTEFPRRRFQIRERPNPPKRRHRKTAFLQKSFLAQPVLREVQHLTIRSHRHDFRRRARGRGRHILELKRHHPHQPRELANLVQVPVITGEFDIPHLPRRRIRLRRKHDDAIPQLARRNR